MSEYTRLGLLMLAAPLAVFAFGMLLGLIGRWLTRGPGGPDP